MNALHRSASLHVVTCALLLAAGITHFSVYRFFQPDDTFIFLVYAKNFLAGSGLTFNGEHVEGFSSLSWTLIISSVGLICSDLLHAAKIAGALAYISQAFLLAGILQRWRRSTTLTDATLLMLLFFAIPSLAIWAASGMETVFFSLLLTAAAFCYLIETTASPSPTRGILSGLLFGVLSTTRPEGFALIAIPCSYEFASLLLLRKFNWKTLATAVLIFLVLTLSLLAWRSIYFGELLPITAHAKTGDLKLQLVNGFNYVMRFRDEYFYLAAAYAAACIYLLLKPKDNARKFALMSIITIGGYITFVIAVGGDWMISYRLLVAIVPAALLTIALAISDCRATSTKIMLITPLLVLAIIDSHALYQPARQQAESDKGDILMGEYIRDMHLPASEKIAVIDAGAIPYFSGLAAIDMVGLNNAHIAKLPGGFFQKFDNAYVLAQQPRIIQMHTEQRPSGAYVSSPVFIGTVQLFYSDEFQKNYELDMQAPVRHLFRRRSVSLPSSMMDSFYDFSAALHRDATQGVATLSITKTGNGIWVSAPVEQLGSVHIHYRIESRDGKILSEKSVALKKDVLRNDSIEIPLSPQELALAGKITVDPVLIGVVRFSAYLKSVSIDVAQQ